MIVDYLIHEHVPYAFGLCGHGNIGLIDALFERSDDIKTVSGVTRPSAGFMADVYYRISGKPTATFTSCGPGSANLPICLANAYLDSVPFLAVTGNLPTSQIQPRRFPGTVSATPSRLSHPPFAPYCKRVFQPTRGEQVPIVSGRHGRPWSPAAPARCARRAVRHLQGGRGRGGAEAAEWSATSVAAAAPTPKASKRPSTCCWPPSTR